MAIGTIKKNLQHITTPPALEIKSKTSCQCCALRKTQQDPQIQQADYVPREDAGTEALLNAIGDRHFPQLEALREG